MLHILLMILKILGILILSILGLGLCIGLLVLLCPIRYYLEGSIYGKPEGKIRISWLLRLVCATISYKENRAEYKICILGIRLKRRKKEEKEDSENIDAEKAKKRFSFFKKWKKPSIIGKKKAEKENEQTERIEELEKKEEIKIQQAQADQKEEIKEQQIQTDKEEENTQQIQADKEEKVQPEEIKTEQKIPEETAEKKQSVLEKVIIKTREILEKIKNILAKIKEILIKIKGIPAKIKSIPAKIQKLFELLRNLNKKKQVILAFIKDEKNKEAFRHTKGRLFRILFHVLPGKVTLKLHYGFEDPATTGMLTGMIFMFYPRSAERFQLTPDFEKRVLEGELTLKGRVQLIRVLWNLFSIYSHKECNRIIKMILKKLKTR